MAVVISSMVFTTKDVTGNPHVDGYFLVEFRNANYADPGEAMDLSAYMRRIEVPPIATPVSGALYYETRPTVGDFPGNAGSGRLSLYYMGSGIVTLNISGLRVSLLSGLPFTVSGVLQAGSGQIQVTGSGAFNAGLDRIQVLSGVAVSGTRAMLHVVGH